MVPVYLYTRHLTAQDCLSCSSKGPPPRLWDRKYSFYEVENPNEKIGLGNKFKLVNRIESVHNVYDDDIPDIVDLNNGRIFSWLNDDSNIKVIDYYPEQKIIFSKNGYTLHNAGLVSDKYLLLFGLTYPTYYTWLFDIESLEVIYTWETPENDSFHISIKENGISLCGLFCWPSLAERQPLPLWS